MAINVKEAITQTNIADSLDDKELDAIGQECLEGYKRDLQSRRNWETKLDEWTKLATMVKENKTWPWLRASNVKYPLLATAAMQFNARAYPTLVPSDGQIVKCEIVGSDPDGTKSDRAERIEKHMSYQIMKEMECWEDDMDRLLLILPIIGTCFKKTYWDKTTGKNVSKLVLPQDLVVNYWAKDLESAERKTEKIEMSARKVKERQLQGIFREVELAPPTRTVETASQAARSLLNQPSTDDETTPYTILEQHTFLELDDDEYPEPYVVTFEEKSGKVLRIAARFDDEGVETNADGKVTKITPIEFYTKYEFVPNPDGGFYSIGFGVLLGPINEAVNTLVNQLVDAGTLSNLQSGFIGKGLRIKIGDARFTPGEWKQVNTTGEDLGKNVFPLPVREPSKVLFELLGMMVQSGKELASVAEIFVGKMPGQNTPATTTMATIEQGMKVFTAIYKRVYRSLTKEFKKIFQLNKAYLDPQAESQILDQPIQQNDYDDKSYDICPAADPQAVSNTEKQARAERLVNMLQLGTLDPMKVTERVLEAAEEPRWQDLIRQSAPPPDPKMLEMQAKQQLAQAQAQMKMQMEAMKAEYEQKNAQAQAAMDQQMKAQELQFKQAMAELELKKKTLEMQMDLSKQVNDHKMAMVDHHMKMQQNHENHQMKMKQQSQAKENNAKE